MNEVINTTKKTWATIEDFISLGISPLLMCGSPYSNVDYLKEVVYEVYVEYEKVAKDKRISFDSRILSVDSVLKQNPSGEYIEVSYSAIWRSPVDRFTKNIDSVVKEKQPKFFSIPINHSDVLTYNEQYPTFSFHKFIMSKIYADIVKNRLIPQWIQKKLIRRGILSKI